MSFFVENLYTVILIPFWAALLILLGKLFAVISSKKVVNIITFLSTIYCLFFAIGAFTKTLVEKGFVYENVIPFLTVSKFNFTLGMYIDGVTTWFLLLAVIISLIVQIYSMAYMRDDLSYVRFFAYLNLFNFSMFGLILAPNMFQIYVFWELVGVTSYLLIGFWYKNRSVSDAAKRAFIINRIGDFAFLAGIVLSAYIILANLGNVSSITLPFVEMPSISAQIYGCTSDGIFILTCILLLFGSIAKSAQFPLHTWLIDAMKGPTPVSALIHSATMVAAGVFLLIRLYPLYSLSNIILNIISIIGIVTALICSYSALTQTDIKKILAYSTNAQLGLMFLAVGSCSATISLLHLTSHAFAKALLFLIAGTVILAMNSNQDIRFAGGLRRKLPVCAYTYLVGIISLSGLLFSGYTSKEMIFSSLIQQNHYIFAILFEVVAFMTVYYLFRLYFYTFEGELVSDYKEPKNHLVYTPILLAFFVVGLWFVFPKSANLLIILFNIVIFVLALITSYIAYRFRNNIKKVPLFYDLSYRAFFADDVNNFISNIYCCLVKILSYIEKYICEGLSYILSLCVRISAFIFSKFQTGNVQSYLSYSLLIMMFSFGGLLLVYSLVIYFSEVQ
ncbi:NADH-quinone oxidoreductase subunit L [bacterium]|nr:NADH-quinone oxidoreductase subunit L [bacterium]